MLDWGAFGVRHVAEQLERVRRSAEEHRVDCVCLRPVRCATLDLCGRGVHLLGVPTAQNSEDVAPLRLESRDDGDAAQGGEGLCHGHQPCCRTW